MMLRQVLPLIALIAIAASFSVVHAVTPCNPTLADPFPSAGRSIITSDSSAWLATTMIRNGIGVRLHSLTNFASVTPFTHPILIRAPTCTLAQAGTVPYVPYYGKSLSMSGDILAIGAPNRYDGSAWSRIDLYSLYAYTTNSSSPAAQPIMIYDGSSSNLGVLLSMDLKSNSLASYYDENNIIVYNPILGRGFNFSYDASLASNDSMIPLPSGFTLDSITLNGGVLFASGLVSDSISGNCIPTISVWVYQPPSSTGTRKWNYLQQLNLLQSSAAGVSADSNSIPCFTQSNNALPLILSADTSKLIVGSPQQGCVYVVDVVFAALATSVTLTPHVRCADPNVFGMNFGQDVGFIDSTSGSSFTVASLNTVTQFVYSDWVRMLVLIRWIFLYK